MALREGISTGSCAAAAAKAAALLAETGKCPALVSVATPQGEVLTLEPFCFADGSCGVVKDAGDDPDITNGVTVRASLEIGDSDGPVTFAAGRGVGTVTLAGLKVQPGEPAINPAPRKMICDVLREVLGGRAVKVTVSVPEGERTARKTFNPRLGVTGGISILGTSGIVKPMNEESIWRCVSVRKSSSMLMPPKAPRKGSPSPKPAICRPSRQPIQMDGATISFPAATITTGRYICPPVGRFWIPA